MFDINKYRAENREKIREYNRNWYQANKERLREEREEKKKALGLKPKISLSMRRFGKRETELTPEEYKELKRLYAFNNRAKYRQYHNEYRKRNKERINEKQREMRGSKYMRITIEEYKRLNQELAYWKARYKFHCFIEALRKQIND